ncbi:MAG TPA: hypothetical protein VF209_05065 [Patescibacteria group bacterium]
MREEELPDKYYVDTPEGCFNNLVVLTAPIVLYYFLSNEFLTTDLEKYAGLLATLTVIAMLLVIVNKEALND